MITDCEATLRPSGRRVPWSQDSLKMITVPKYQRVFMTGDI